MKKYNLLKLLSLLFILAILMCAVAIPAFAAEEQQIVEISKKNIVFGEKLQLLFAVNAPDNVTVTAVCGTDTIGIDFVGKKTIGDVEYRIYRTSEGWAAQNINAVVTVTATANGKTDVLSYSVLMYLYERLNLDNLDPETEADRIAMYEALLSYAKAADKVVNNEDGRTPNNFDSYHYVSVENGTLDGYNSWGMFKEGETPFTNIEHSFDLAEGETVEWSYAVNGEDKGKISLEALKTLSVEGAITVTAVYGHSNHDGIEGICQPITNEQELEAAVKTDGNYYLVNDIELTKSLTVSANVGICLNGKILSAAEGKPIFSVPETEVRHTLTITDCSSVERAGYIDPATNKWVEGTAGEGMTAVTLKGGILMGGTSDHGGAIYIQNSTLNVYNVNFVNNSARIQGGAIYANTADVTLNNVTFVANGCTYIQAEEEIPEGVEGRGGAIYLTKGDLTTVECSFVANSSSNNGGAIYLTGTSVVYNDNGSTFAYNSGINGGAIATYGEVTLTNTKFNANAATSGGAVWANGGTLNVESAIFAGNTSTGHGGALYIGDATVTTKSSVFVANIAATGSFGGAIYVSSGGTYTDGVENDTTKGSTFGGDTADLGNSATSGGSILSSGITKLYGTTFNNNTAEKGGAIYATGGSLDAYGASFTSNKTNGGHGGAIYVGGAAVNTQSCTFTGNTADGKYGGAVYVNSSSTYTDGVENDATKGSTFGGDTAGLGNSATSGGAILSEGTTTLYGSKFKNNTAGAGGAIYVLKGTTTVHNATFTSNSSTAGQAGAIYTAATLNTYSCSFTNNTTVSGKNGGAVYISGAGNYTDGEIDEEGKVSGGSTFNGNTSGNYGGAIGTFGPTTLYGSKFIGNSATTTGGAIHSGEVLNTYSCEFTNNSAKTNGGAINLTSAANYTDTDSKFEGNSTKNNGGAIHSEGKLNVSGTKFLNNSISDTSSTNYYGGAIAISSGAATISGAEFKGNSSDYYGGAISANGSSTVTINGGTVVEENTGKTGSALYFMTTGKVTMDTVTVKNNNNGTNGVVYVGKGTEENRHVFTNITATGNSANKGGVFYISGGYVTIENSSLTENATSGSEGWGGAIYISQSNRLILNGVTIQNNTAKLGGGIYKTSSSINVTIDDSCIISGNTASTENGGNDVYPE